MRIVTICGIALAAAAFAGCASQQQASTGPRSPNQVKQDDLKGMEAQGQRNDIDRVRVN